MKRLVNKIKTSCFTQQGNSFQNLFNWKAWLMIGVFGLVSFASKAGGKETYDKMCMTCHSLSDKVLVGPGLGGVNERRSEEWLIKWVHDPMGMVNGGDADAVKLYEEFNKIPMPGFPQLKDDEIKELIAFFGEQGKAEAAAPATGGSDAAAPSTPSSSVTGEASASKDITGELIFWCFVGLGIIAYLLQRFRRKTLGNMESQGYHGEPHYLPNFFWIFVLYLSFGVLVICLLVYFLAQKESMVNTMLFSALPYTALFIFLIGSIYRYKQRGYQVSSLSSQFLEGKKLFWSSQPFHWGMLVLFLGHLTAFLFPRAILAWNGEPVRLLILEFSAFAFGISALFGLIMFIKRRLSTKMILVVTNKMDMVVYLVLLTQIISGLGVALMVRWGSSWFSGVLTPYLKSIFSFNPDITAVSEMPVLIQIHIVSAFVIIAIIPFTRFMHFLVAPLDYAWRKYQVVVWNWDRKAIRKSVRHFYGKKARNH